MDIIISLQEGHLRGAKKARIIEATRLKTPLHQFPKAMQFQRKEAPLDS